jgi:hypothetical protein
LTSSLPVAATKRSKSPVTISILHSNLMVHNSRSPTTQSNRSINRIPILTPAVT